MKSRRSHLVAPTVVAIAALVTLAACGGDETTTTTTTDAAAAATPFDRAFIDGMVPHHEDAIAMANSAKDTGLAEPDLVEIADDIIATQQVEIDQMKLWREEWFGSSEIDPDGAEPLGLTEEEMGMQHDPEALEQSQDVDGDFAAMMIDHHEGAITMSELALEQSDNPEVRELAEQILETQRREIGVMAPHATDDGMAHP